MAIYNPNDAAAFNKALQSGLSPADAAKQVGITPEAASQYALGSNNNLGSLTPGAGSTPATEQTVFTTQQIPQTVSGQPTQGVQLAAAAPSVFNGVINRDGTITFFTPGQDQTLSTGPATTIAKPAISASGQANSVPATTPPTTTTQNVGPFATGYRGVAGPLTQAPPLPNSRVVPVDVIGPLTADNAPRATAAEPFRVEVTGTGINQSAAEDARLARAPIPLSALPTARPLANNIVVPVDVVPAPVFRTLGAAQDGQGGTVPTAGPEPVIDELSAYPPNPLGANVAEDARFARNAAPVPDELSAYPPNPVDLPNDRRMNDADYINSLETAANKFNTVQQAAIESTYKQPGNGDWRFRISLAEGADYLYKASDSAWGRRDAGGSAGLGAGILAPLATTNGVVFPYTPQVTTSYQAKYNTYDLVHSNYRGVFYQNSSVSEINVRGTFTAQDTKEAEYLLAVIHFFRSVTKMFYGQDSQRGAPPPLVYLTGLGDYQFNAHPAVVTNFEYSLPNDVDYIRANNPNNFGTDLLNRRAGALSPPSNPLSAIATRLGLSGLFPGATPSKPSYGAVTNSVTNTAKATYVPTKIDINVSLLPVQTRDQVSKLFSLKDFAEGNLLRGGFW